ncbi:MAG: ABC transporter permease subunit [Methylobacterium frigidaeris]
MIRDASPYPLALAVLAAASLVGLPLLTLAPNRLVPGLPHAGGPVAGAAAVLALVAGFLIAVARGRPGFAAAGIAAALAALAALGLATGQGATLLLDGKPAAARAALGSGAWLALLALLGLLGDGARAAGRRLAAPLALLGLAALAAAGLGSGVLDHLSLAVEYRGRAGAVNAAILQHLGLSAAALVLAGLVAVPLALARLDGGRAGRIADGVIGGVQVVPALALFAGLVSALSALLALVPALRGLGLAAVGPTPAVIGTAAYLLLPLVRSLSAGLASPDPAVLDAARAVGLTPRQELLRVRLPLGAPILLGGVRVAAVQSIGLSTLGGLVGAGGLGAVVFEGMAQFASDLILLGALPVVVLSLAADRLLSLLGDRLASGRLADTRRAGTRPATGGAA